MTPLRRASPPPPRPNRLGPLLLRCVSAAFLLVCIMLDLQIVRANGVTEDSLPMLLRVLLVELEAFLAVLALLLLLAALLRRDGGD